MKHGLLLFPKSCGAGGPDAFAWWISEAAALGIDLQQAFFEDMTVEFCRHTMFRLCGEDIDKPDFVIMRGYCAEVSVAFETAGIPVFNRWAAMAASLNKVITHNQLVAAGIPTPRTFWSPVPPAYQKACEILGSNVFVAKQPDSSRGCNVYLVHDADEYAAANTACGGNMLVQEYIASSHGRDLRVWTVGDTAVAQVLRHSETSFLSNFSQGGSASPFPLAPVAAAMAVGAANAIGLDIAGVDLLFTADGNYTVCEVNGNAGFRTLSATGGPNIIKMYMEYIHSKVYGN